MDNGFKVGSGFFSPAGARLPVPAAIYAWEGGSRNSKDIHPVELYWAELGY